MAAWVAWAGGGAGVARAGVQDYGGGLTHYGWLGLGFGAALTGPASGIGRRLVMHTSAAHAVVTMLGQLPASELVVRALLP